MSCSFTSFWYTSLPIPGRLSSRRSALRENFSIISEVDKDDNGETLSEIRLVVSVVNSRGEIAKRLYGCFKGSSEINNISALLIGKTLNWESG
ncbi:hypothetical protein E2C01_002895 [Portunus trituberculatus]|uniref:Uncharacterized protein n=1 Tax=Portunus trituberculatus TaxID=210409 RepID=A0A5B7CKP0_PORTR|nr:hypothetical protein [Portunus trituberculatus]